LVKKENIVYTNTGYYFEYRNEYFLMNKKLPQENIIDIDYMIKNLNKPFVKIQSFYFGQEVSFYESIKFLEKAPIVVSAKGSKDFNPIMPIAATDSIVMVPVKVEYRMSSLDLNVDNVTISKYDDFFFKDENSQKLIRFELDRNRAIDIISISLPYGKMKLRSTDTAFIFGYQL